jgi:hypothetical protein
VRFQYSPIFDVVRGLRAPAFSDQMQYAFRQYAFRSDFRIHLCQGLTLHFASSYETEGPEDAPSLNHTSDLQ